MEVIDKLGFANSKRGKKNKKLPDSRTLRKRNPKQTGEKGVKSK